LIYFDNAATTFPKPDGVYQSIQHHLKNYAANPGRSGHKMAFEAGKTIFLVRELLCQLFNIENPMQLIFTSNATDSLNLAIKGLLKAGDHVITTSMEHNSVLRPIKSLESKGVTNTIIECDEFGQLDPRKISEEIKTNTKLIVLTHASNVTGNIMPIEAVGKIAKENNICFLVDAAQTAGVYPIDVQEMGIDLLALPAHKGLLGIQGLGVLYIREGLEIDHSKEGGTGSKSEELLQPLFLPDRYESGTPNTPGIVALGSGIEFILNEGIDKIRRREEQLTEYFLDGLRKIPKIKIYGAHHIAKQAAVISINIGDEDSSEIGSILDESFDIAVRAGLHCAPLAHRTIGTFEQGTIRFSLGYFNTEYEIDKAIEALKIICEDN